MKIAVTAQHDMAPASVMERAGRDKLAAVFETALIIIGQAALLVLLPHHVFSDGAVRYREMVALLQRHTIPTQKFSIIGPLFSTPVFLVGLLLKLPHAGVGVYNWCVLACVGYSTAKVAEDTKKGWEGSDTPLPVWRIRTGTARCQIEQTRHFIEHR